MSFSVIEAGAVVLPISIDPALVIASKANAPGVPIESMVTLPEVVVVIFEDAPLVIALAMILALLEAA